MHNSGGDANRKRIHNPYPKDFLTSDDNSESPSGEVEVNDDDDPKSIPEENLLPNDNISDEDTIGLFSTRDIIQSTHINAENHQYEMEDDQFLDNFTFPTDRDQTIFMISNSFDFPSVFSFPTNNPDNGLTVGTVLDSLPSDSINISIPIDSPDILPSDSIDIPIPDSPPSYSIDIPIPSIDTPQPVNRLTREMRKLILEVYNLYPREMTVKNIAKRITVEWLEPLFHYNGSVQTVLTYLYNRRHVRGMKYKIGKYLH